MSLNGRAVSSNDTSAESQGADGYFTWYADGRAGILNIRKFGVPCPGFGIALGHMAPLLCVCIT